MVCGLAVAAHDALGHVLGEQRHGILHRGLAEHGHAHHRLLPGTGHDDENGPFGGQHGLHADGDAVGRQSLVAAAELPLRVGDNGLVRHMNRPGLGIGVLLQRDVVHIGNGALVPSDRSSMKNSSFACFNAFCEKPVPLSVI